MNNPIQFGNLKLPRWVVWLVALALLTVVISLLAVIGRPTTPEDAAPVAQAYVQALAAKDAVRMDELSCPGWQAQAALEVQSLKDASAVMNDVNCRTVGLDLNRTLVQCSGSITFTYAGVSHTLDLATRTFEMLRQGNSWRVCGYR